MGVVVVVVVVVVVEGVVVVVVVGRGAVVVHPSWLRVISPTPSTSTEILPRNKCKTRYKPFTY